MAGGAAGLLLLCILCAALPEEGLALTCPWPSGSSKLEGYIPGNPKSMYGINGAEECRDQCMSQSTFICAAVNYKVSGGMCELLAENKQTASMIEPVDDSWQHFIRPSCAGIWLPWRAEKGKYITGGNSFSNSTADNLQDCMTSCVRDPSGGNECKAINIRTSSDNNDNCKLRSDAAGGGDTISENSKWQYFNRPIWYSESSVTSTSADIRNQGTIGYYLQIFTQLTLPASGYLVAWQYYMKTVVPCETYASIWRPNNDASSYTLISNTLLAPEESFTEGVRFQYIQNEIIRVQQSDVLSVHVVKIDGCDNQIVSVNGEEGSMTTITITNYRKLHINTTKSRITNPGLETTIRRATPALKAYVSAYLTLNGSLQTYHDTSLSSGQIWLKLPSLPATEESVVVAGYKVICSTDDNRSFLVSCHDSLVPVSSREVLLNLSDVTITYHVSVQIARNFNGTELLDDKYSPVSSAFCTGRKKTDQVNISESTVSDVETKPEVNVTFLHTFQADDMCAQEIKLNYSGYESENRTIGNNLQREFILQLEQGTTYGLTIYLKLADGAEIAFWTQEYTAAFVSTPAADAGDSSAGNSATIAASVIVPLVVLAAIVVVIVILYRRGSFNRSGTKPITADLNRVEETELDGADYTYAGNLNRTPPETKPKPEYKPRPSSKPNQPALEEGPTYENSTRILVQNLHQRIQEEKMRCPEHPFKDEYLTLDNPQLSFAEGRTSDNAKRNRFKNITAFDMTRVKLRVANGHSSDYINACYIKDYTDKVKFIAAQGPNDVTLVDMWRMIHTTKAKVIVMVTNAVECGKKKCSPYWPETDTAKFGEYSVTLAEETKFAFYIIRKMRYSVDGERGTVTQCQYTEWYDQDVPSTAGLLSFRARVKQEIGASQAPVIVHCSAGVGRTGTYIALENLIQEASDKRMKQKSVDVIACVNKLRGQRMHMVQVPEQYAFLYDVVSEALSCGETAVLSSEFSQTLRRWRKPGGAGCSALSEQFAKLNLTSGNFPDEMYCIAASEENVSKNRDQRALPLNSRRVLISHPERGSNDYINATFCNGYQQKDGFLVAQTPLATTTADYWRMIMEQKCTFVVYFNDCQKEAPYIPYGGQTIKAGKITVKNIQTTSWDDGSGHFQEETNAAETVVECKDNSKMQRVTILEIKMRGTKLPTSKQLVSLCQKSERYTTSGTDVIAVQCRNGCRLSGLFVIAMNLYLRTRIEHEVDIVLEVKLARLSRAQFISKLEEFEALYDFVEYYLSEFNEYSNFTDLGKSRK